MTIRLNFHRAWRALVFAFSVLVPLSWSAANAQTCGLTSSFMQPDEEQRKVLYDAGAVVFSEKFAVNTDGNIRSYSAKDPAGDLCGLPENKDKDPFALGCAMNTICNGANMQVPVPGGKTVTYNYKQCTPLLAAFKRARDANWKPTDGTKIIPVGIDMKDGVPCTTPEGFIVSTASAMSGLGGKVCEQKRFLDAAVPSIVVPKCWSATYRAANSKTCNKDLPVASVIDVAPGDLVTVRGRSSGKLTYAVVGDLGPNKKLGEASIGLHVAVTGKKDLPRTKLESYAYDKRELYDVLIFRGSKLNVPLTPEDFKAMSEAAAKRFAEWGGDVQKAEARMQACGLTARPN